MTEKADERKCLAVVRLRGTIRAQCEARETLEMLRLSRCNHVVLIDNRPAYLGMLQQVQNYVTWGAVTKDIVALLLKKRGRLAGSKKLTDEYARKIGYESLDMLAEAIAACKVEYQKLPNIRPIFKLPPPSKGFKGTTKKSYKTGGELGYRGEAISKLIKRML